ncbi:superinfection immunity protein [Burkholderia ambifaria]|uniref:superinfection immunity protein n=1 Tax=Burkholderia ambifaria TaxID=152480 RepID=UPI0020120345|nr:superinfection immunity protein [Burkholderia ambifaria]
MSFLQAEPGAYYGLPPAFWAVMDVIGTMAIGAACAVLLFAMYFLPALIARRRKHRNYDAILAKNFLFGCTFIGWASR